MVYTKRESLYKHLLSSLDEKYTLVPLKEEDLDNQAYSDEAFDLFIFHIYDQEDQKRLEKISAKGVPLLILDSEPTLAMALYLLKYDIKGYTNAFSNKKNLLLAIKVILQGDIYLPQEYMIQMVSLLHNTIDATQITQVQGGFLTKIKEFLTTHLGRKNIFTQLTKREMEVALCVSEGMSNKEIAQKLNISASTVKTHLLSIYEKLNIHDRLSLALKLKG